MKNARILILLGLLSLSVVVNGATTQKSSAQEYLNKRIEKIKNSKDKVNDTLEKVQNKIKNEDDTQDVTSKTKSKIEEILNKRKDSDKNSTVENSNETSSTTSTEKNKKTSFWNKILNKKDENKDWKLVWSDEFDTANKLDETKWSYWGDNNIPWNAGNYLDESGNLVDQYGFKAKQYYLHDNVNVKDGNLVIEIKKEDNKTINIDGKQRKILYSSGAVHTRGKFSVQEGKIEMRAAMPKGVGTWPAFWMWPAYYSQSIGKPATGEIDIFEIYGSDLRRVTGTTHVLRTTEDKYQTFDGDDLKIKKNEDLTKFNTYAVEWDSKEIRWLFNGRVYKKRTMKEMAKKAGRNPFNQPYFIMINVALENQTGSDGDINFPTEMKVDYVRVYQKKSKIK